MKTLIALFLFVCLAGCRPAQDGSVSISEIEALAVSGYRGKIVVSGYYFYHSEQDAIYQEPRPDSGIPKVILQMAPILERANITASDWRARQTFMRVFDRQFVTITGELKNEVFRVGGVQIEDPPPRTFIRVEKIEFANQSPQRNAGSRPSSGDLPVSETSSSFGPRG